MNDFWKLMVWVAIVLAFVTAIVWVIQPTDATEEANKALTWSMRYQDELKRNENLIHQLLQCMEKKQ